jgi:hypothetical protein
VNLVGADPNSAISAFPKSDPRAASYACQSSAIYIRHPTPIGLVQHSCTPDRIDRHRWTIFGRNSPDSAGSDSNFFTAKYRRFYAFSRKDHLPLFVQA